MISRTHAALLLSGWLLVGNTLASSLPDGVVYSKTGTFNQQISFTDNFHVDVNGLYEATLKDLENTEPFTESSLEVKSGASSLGSVSGPGAFTFEAGPGDYFVSLFASVMVSDEEKQRMIDELRKHAASAWWEGLSAERKQAWKEYSSTWTDELRMEKKAKTEEVFRNRVERELAHMSQGEYDIQIALLDPNAGGNAGGAAVVPVPAAAWLFVSGLIGLTGLARRKR